MRRHAFGLFALAFLAAAAVGLYQSGVSAARASMTTSILLRVGLVLLAIWLAYPQLRELARRTPPWLIAGLAFGLLLLLIQPKAFRVLLPLLLILLAFQFLGQWLRPPPPPRSRSAKRSGSRQSGVRS